MKSLLFILALSCTGLSALAQQIGFTYQAAALDESKAEGFGRDSKGQVLINQDLAVRFSIHEQSVDGVVQYQELHYTTTDIFGIFRVVIGSGEKILGTSLEALQWSDQSYFMQVEIDLGAGFINMGAEVIVVPPFGLDNTVQLLNLAGTQLAISDGNSVDLSNLLNAAKLTEQEVDAYVANNGYLLVEVDGSVTNELQSLSSNGAAGHLAISQGNEITINVNDADADPTNEIQTLSKSGIEITLSNGGGTFSVADNDNDSQNEIQDLQLSSNQLTITNNPAATTINLSPYLGNNLTEEDVDNMVANNGYLTTEVDGSITNEIQDLNLIGNTLTITNNTSPTNIDLTPYQNVFETTSGVTSNENGNYATDDFVFGSPQLANNGNPDHNARVFFDKSKGAFRAGRVSAARWDDENIGYYSVGLGHQAWASGFESFAVSRGYAESIQSIALGNSFSRGAYAFAAGRWNSADGDNSVALGHQNYAPSYGETAIGVWNTEYTPNSAFDFHLEDRLFVIGNGTGDFPVNLRSNALVMLKNGNTRLHGQLTIDADNFNGAGEAYTLPGQDGAANQALVTDGNGNVTWTNADNSTTNEIQDLELDTNTHLLSISQDPTPAATIDLTPYQNVFEITNNVTSNENGDYANDDFVFGSPQLADDGNPAHDVRFFFDKSKGAFRAGYTNGTAWNDENVGLFSTAFGHHAIASGLLSVSLGYSNTASGIASFASGMLSTASGYSSFSLGDGSTAAGVQSFAGGGGIASGEASFAFGSSAQATNNYSTSIGYNTVSSGLAATAFGQGTLSKSYGEFVVGSYNTDYNPTNLTVINLQDRLFVIGNGTFSSRSNALVMLKNGNTRLHGQLTIDADNVTGAGGSYTLPGQRGANRQIMVTDGDGQLSWGNQAFTTNNGITSNIFGSYATDSFIFGSGSLDYIFGTSNSARAMSFNKSKGSFRAGNTLHNGHGTNVGMYSVAFGSGNAASGTGSAAFGSLSIASGTNSFAVGSSNSTASGVSSASFGHGPHAIGNYSLAAGFHTRANAYGEIAFGFFNTDAAGNGLLSVSTDRLFSIGNGVDNTNRSDALVMLKNGNTRLHGQLTIDADNVNGAGEAYTLPGQDGTANQALVTDGNGNVSWTNADNSTTNEIQDLELNTNTHLLSISQDPTPAATIDLTPYQNVFETTNNVTSNENGDYANDDFVFGSPQLDYDNVADHQGRMFFDKSKSAFRVGSTTGNRWDDINRGTNSIGIGDNTTASNNRSIAIGHYATASGIGSYAFGTTCTASGNSAFAIGTNSSAQGSAALAIHGGLASGSEAIAIGSNANATGNFSFALNGISSNTGATAIRGSASGINSIAIGNGSQATGFGSIAINASISSGNYSSTIGFQTYARSYGENAQGLYNTDYVPVGPFSFAPTDRLLSIGNGNGNASRSDALVMLKNGNTRLHGQLTIDADNITGAGEQYTLPGQDGSANQALVTDGNGIVSWATPINQLQDLAIANDVLTITNNAAATDIDLGIYLDAALSTTNNLTSNGPGNYTNDSFVFGSPSLDDDGDANHDTRMFFEKSTGAFRVGTVEDVEWNSAERGTNSIAMGNGNIARGDYSLSLGLDNLAHSASSIAIGTNNVAEGYNSIALGRNVSTTGLHSMALSFYSDARSFAETTMGMFATEYVPNATQTFDANDRLFTIGNGTADGARSNALVILKNGDASLNGNLTIDADNVSGSGEGYTLPGQDGVAGQLLITDGDGQASWSNIIDSDLTVTGVFSNPSDRRLKRNITPLSNSLTNVTILNGFNYNWNSQTTQDTLALQTGLIAQEVEKIFPELVKTDEEGFKSVNYIGLVPHLIEAIKELKLENQELKSDNLKTKTAVEQRVADLEEKILRFESLLAKGGK